MRNRTNVILLALLLSVAGTPNSWAYMPSVADMDAAARAVGNRRDIAQKIGESIFRTTWSAQVSQISANQLGTHLILGIRVWGVKFHHPLTRDEFVNEIVALVARAFAAAPNAEEVDIWASVPISVVRGAVVSGDLAKPTSRTVFSVTTHRSESAVSLRSRMTAGGDSVFWDLGWTAAAFRPAG